METYTSDITSFHIVADTFDEHGYISVKRNPYTVRIDIAHRSLSLLEDIQKILGCGGITQHGWQYHYVITGNDNCRNVLRAILPLLIRKQHVAELALQLAERTGMPRTYRLSEEEKALRESLYCQIIGD